MSDSKYYGGHNAHVDYKRILAGVNIITGNTLTDYIKSVREIKKEKMELSSLKDLLEQKIEGYKHTQAIDTALNTMRPRVLIDEIINDMSRSELNNALRRKSPETAVLFIIKTYSSQ